MSEFTTGMSAWSLVIAHLEEQSIKRPRSEEAMARRRRIANDARAMHYDYQRLGAGIDALVGDGSEALRLAYNSALDGMMLIRKALEEGRAVDGLYQSAVEQVIAIKAQIELDSAIGIGGAS